MGDIGARVLQVAPLDFSQHPPQAVAGTLERWAGWLAAGVVEAIEDDLLEHPR